MSQEVSKELKWTCWVVFRCSTTQQEKERTSYFDEYLRLPVATELFRCANLNWEKKKSNWSCPMQYTWILLIIVGHWRFSIIHVSPLSRHTSFKPSRVRESIVLKPPSKSHLHHRCNRYSSFDSISLTIHERSFFLRRVERRSITRRFSQQISLHRPLTIRQSNLVPSRPRVQSVWETSIGRTVSCNWHVNISFIVNVFCIGYKHIRGVHIVDLLSINNQWHRIFFS